VCINCQHLTAGQYCESCEEGYYRETGKNFTDADVCTPCRCSGPGVKPGKLDCVKVCCLVTFCHTQLNKKVGKFDADITDFILYLFVLVYARNGRFIVTCAGLEFP
jgi:hypothetical protein